MSEIRTFDIGDVVLLSGEFFADEAEVVPADPDDVALVVRQPDQAVVRYTYPPAGTINRTATGVFQTQLEVDQSGRWRYRWEGTGAVKSAGEAEFWVRRSGVYGR
jgi:hypothetical protein